MKNAKNIGRIIRKLRRGEGLTQAELGRKINLSGAAVGYLERNKRGFPINLLTKIRRVFKKPLSYFCSGNGEYTMEHVCDKLTRIEKIFRDVKNILKCKR